MVIATFLLLIFVSAYSYLNDFILEEKNKIGLFLIGFILIVFSGLRVGEKMPDYGTYVGLYQQIVSGEITYFIELSFIALVNLSNFIAQDNFTLIFFIYAIIGVLLKFYAIHELSKFYFFSIVIYVSNYFILHEMIQIRAGVATGFILLSLIYVHKRNLRYFILFILSATFFHYSSIIFLFLWFLKPDEFNKLSYLGLIPLAYLIYLTRLDPITLVLKIISPDAVTVKSAYIDKERASDLAINVFGIYALTRIIIVSYFSYFAELISIENKYFPILIKCYTIGLFSYIAFASFPEFAVRIGYTLMSTEIIIIPTLIYTIDGYFTSRNLVLLFAFVAFTLNVFFTSYFNWT